MKCRICGEETEKLITCPHCGLQVCGTCFSYPAKACKEWEAEHGTGHLAEIPHELGECFDCLRYGKPPKKGE